jgi:hypothetical protein
VKGAKAERFTGSFTEGNKDNEEDDSNRMQSISVARDRSVSRSGLIETALAGRSVVRIATRAGSG